MLPKHILKSAEKNLTSLGDNPCLPPEEETNFIVNILTRYYDKLTDGKDINEQQIQEEFPYAYGEFLQFHPRPALISSSTLHFS